MSKHGGFTLIELLIVMAIAGLLFAGLLQSLVVSGEVHGQLSKRDRILADVESVALGLSTDLARAGFLSSDPAAVTWLAQNWSASSYPTIEVDAGSAFDDLTIRWGAVDSECPCDAEETHTVDGQTRCIRKVEYFVSDGGLQRDLDEADAVTVLPYTVEAFKVFFGDRDGNWSDQMPADATDLSAVGVYLRVRTPYDSDAGCGTYPSSEALAAFGSAADLGIPEETYSNCSNLLRMERVVSVGLANLQRY